MDVNARLKFINDLDGYLLEKDKLFSDVLNTLGWNEESLQDEAKVQCPNDPGHWVQESSLPVHLEMCAWVKGGYLKEEKEKQPPSSKFFYQEASAVISLTIDKETQANILLENNLIENKSLDEMPDVPKTIERWSVDLNPEQRLAIYDYAVTEAKTGKNSKNVTVEDLMFDFEKKDDQDDKPKSRLEVLAEQRDYKRRRQSYRAKNVHITKKSYTEVMKEVIENQITFLAETRKQESTDRLADSDSETSIRNVERSSRDSADDGQRQETGHYYSRQQSQSPPPKRRKHKRDRSRSRSRSRRHKKSHKKHKKSRD